MKHRTLSFHTAETLKAPMKTWGDNKKEKGTINKVGKHSRERERI